MGEGVRKAERKVSGGKLVQIKVESCGVVTLTGDFFLHPEERLPDLESFLSSLPLSDNDRTSSAVAAFAERNGIVMIGLRPDDIAALLNEVRQ